jgi:hypothetical protein
MNDILQQRLDGEMLTAANDDEICSRCFTKKNLERHHLSYVPSEAITLCRSCHNYAHNNSSCEFAPEQDPGKLFDEPSAESEAPARANVTVKRINSNEYFYYAWRDGTRVKTEYICSVKECASHPLYVGPKE